MHLPAVHLQITVLHLAALLQWSPQQLLAHAAMDGDPQCCFLEVFACLPIGSSSCLNRDNLYSCLYWQTQTSQEKAMNSRLLAAVQVTLPAVGSPNPAWI